MTTLAKRLDTHFAACAAAAAGAAIVGGAQEANAAIVYSGVVNISIGGNFSGVYLNMINGVTGTSAAAVPGHDINPYYGGNRFFVANVPAGTPGLQATGPAGTGQAMNLGLGAPITNAQSYFAGFPFLSGQFTAGTPGIVGLKIFRESDSATLFGWVRVNKGATNTTAGVIVDYAYNDVAGQGISAGEIPGPGSLALLALGALGLRGRKRN
jgi:hypothetical protein